MAITLNQLLVQIQSKYELTCVAGMEGMARDVSWVYYMEDITTLDFIRGGEIVITTGMRCQEEGWMLELIKEAVKNKASAVIINVGQYVETVSKQAIAYADKKGIPVFLMPWRMHIVDLTQDICNFILLAKQKEFDVKKVFSDFFFKDTFLDGALLEEHGISGKSKFCVLKGKYGTGWKKKEKETEKHLEQSMAQCLGELCQWNVAVCEEDTIFVYVQIEQKQKACKELIAEIKKRLEKEKSLCEIQWGIGNIKTAFEEMKVAKEEAGKAFFVGTMQGKSVMTYEECGIYQILLEVTNETLLKNIYQENLGALECFPEEERHTYLETLRNYIECNGSIQKVAEKSFLHRNTVNYRMKKLKEILPVSLENEQEKFMLWLSFFIGDILKNKKER